MSIFAKVPALGYTTVIIRKEKSEKNYTSGDNCDHISDAPIILENEKLYAEFRSETMELVRLVDKATGNNLVSEPSCSFRFIHERNERGMSSWRVGKYMKTVNINRECRVHISNETHGKLKSFVNYSFKIENSSVDVCVSLEKNSSRLNFSVSADWREFGSNEFIPQLQFHAPLAFDTPVSRCSIPFGTIDRPALDHDVPCTGFMAVPDADGRAAMLMSDCKYGFRNFGSGMIADLIRSSDAPDSMPEIGIHPITLGLAVADYSADSLINEYSTFAHPVSTFANSAHEGTLPVSMSAIKIDNAQITAVKQAEDGSGIIVRLFNPDETAVNAKLAFCREIASAEKVSFTEKKLADLSADGRNLSIEIQPKSIVTIKICFNK